MKIIKRGKKPEEKVYRGKCSKCNTEYECTQIEGRLEQDFREGSEFLRVDCPVCGANTIAYGHKPDALVQLKYPDWGSSIARQIEAVESGDVILR